jgi:CPA2 family monovalent cation:H+ antiporter-2
VASGAAVGRTLAELDLRARTGATVVTIQRHGQRVVLPTGHERLEPGDVLALVGSEEALARALGVLAADADAPLRA